MNNKNILLAFAAGGLLVYLLTRKRRKGGKDVDKSVKKGMVKANKRGLRPNPTSSNSLTNKEADVIQGLNYGMPYSVEAKNIKAPIYQQPENLVPDIYGRRVGMTLGFDGSRSEGFYHNMSGKDSTNIYAACKCAPNTTMYASELPKLP